MTGRLFLLRHAKAAWAQPGMRDFDRSLDASGRDDAETIGLVIRDNDLQPEQTLCSTAQRCRETLQLLSSHADTGRITYVDALYSEDAAHYLDLIRGHASGGSLLMVGHNPMMEDLAAALAGSGAPAAMAALGYGFPTCGLAVMSFPAALSAAAPKTGHLDALLTPADR